MNAADILGMNHRELFSGDAKAIKKEFRRLSKLWHPDRCSDAQASAVFAHLTEMHKLAETGAQPLSQLFHRKGGKAFRMEYRRQTTGNACTIFVGSSSVAYLVAEANDRLSDRAAALKWDFASDAMKTEMERFLPHLRREERLEGGRLFVFSRTSDQILMSDLIEIEGKIDPRHAMWMITRMMNIACYLQWAKLAHLAIAPEFLLVSPEHHSVSLTGPALYATSHGRHPEFAPAKTVSLIPALRQPDFVANSIGDRQLIRQIGRELLGDPSGNRLKNDSSVPPDVTAWLSSAPPESAYDDYEAWEACLGARKFIVYPRTAQQLYGMAA